MRVTALEQGLVPYRGRAPASAAAWDSQAAGSMGRTGSAGQPPRGTDRRMGRGGGESEHKGRGESPFRLGWAPLAPARQPRGATHPSGW